jgi:hypothetical protein
MLLALIIIWLLLDVFVSMEAKEKKEKKELVQSNLGRLYFLGGSTTMDMVQ